MILAFANNGMASASPAIFKALGRASADVAHEATHLQAMRSGPLGLDVQLEAGVLKQTAHANALATDRGALLTVLHRRIATARAAGVSACAGVSPPSALRPGAGNAPVG